MTLFILAGVVGVSCMYMLKSVEDRMDPCGMRSCAWDDLPLKVTCACLPPKQLANHLLLLCMFVLYSLSISLCREWPEMLLL